MSSSTAVAEKTGRIYVYSAPGYDTDWVRTTGGMTVEGRGRYKVGYTGRSDPMIRIKEQTGTVYPDGDGIVVHLDEPAIREDGTAFTDHTVHKVLTDAGIHRTSEVFEATFDEILAALAAVRASQPYDSGRTASFGMRPEQADAVEQTASYYASHAEDPQPARFLWNAKMRFGKTFATYQLAKRLHLRRILVLTYKPAVRTAWKEDLESHVDFIGWRFADRDNAPGPADLVSDIPIVWFASFQDLLGTTTEGDIKDRNTPIHDIAWDLCVLDEYHFGAWQGGAKEVCEVAATTTSEKALVKAAQAAADDADEVVDLAETGTPRLLATNPESDVDHDLTSADLHLDAARFLYLSGTPFRALTDGEFNEDAIFSWTYPDEQREKAGWNANPGHDPVRNPYRSLPAMEMYTYALSEMASKAIDDGADATFDLSKFFSARRVGPEWHFDDPDNVREFLNLIRGQLGQSVTEKLVNGLKPPFPFSDNRFAAGVQHTVWFMPTVASCHAMKAALEVHPYFQNHRIHVAAGVGARMGAEAKKPVDEMLATAAKFDQSTITLSCGKLMTGVTVPQWGAILILRSLKSPEAYFQAAFRVQSPWTRREPDGSSALLKERCFIFDFDPTRALTLIYEYGIRLAGGISRAPSDVIDELIKVLPIFAFDGGRMDAVDVNGVMDWGTAGTGATMLAKRWGSPRLIDLSDTVLNKLLAHSGLVDQLEQMEDFRTLREDAGRILAQSKKLKKPKPAGSDGDDNDPNDDEELKKGRKARREQVDNLRTKLLKLVQRIPVFMFLTDFRESALVHVIESLDTQLFERVTGLTLDNFHELSAIGVFQPAMMNEAIWQFRLFERASLSYLGGSTAAPSEPGTQVGLWSTTVDLADLDHVLDAEPADSLAGSDPEPAEDTDAAAVVDSRLAQVIAQGLLSPGDELTASNGRTAKITDDGGIIIDGKRHTNPTEAAAAVSEIDVDGWHFWAVAGWGSLAEMAEQAEAP